MIKKCKQNFDFNQQFDTPLYWKLLVQENEKLIRLIQNKILGVVKH